MSAITILAWIRFSSNLLAWIMSAKTILAWNLSMYRIISAYYACSGPTYIILDMFSKSIIGLYYVQHIYGVTVYSVPVWLATLFPTRAWLAV
jgi:hypothetical protein